MKTMTCREFGGPCDEKVSSDTFEGIMDKGMEHVRAAHPEMLPAIEAMSKEEMDAWAVGPHAIFDGKPEDVPMAA